MRKISNLFEVLALFVILISLWSCSEDLLETKPLTEYSDADVWSDPALAETYVNNIYREMFWNWQMTSAFCDEVHHPPHAGVQDHKNMLNSPDNLMPSSDWGGKYRRISYCNIALENIDRLPESDELIDGKTIKERLEGEVLFLRAWYYHNLVKYFGGVPIINKAYGLNDDFNAPRDSYADCINFIVSDCDKAAALLPEMHTGDNVGRASKGAALALKSRVLLYAASDLHNTTLFSDYSNPELVGYIDGDQTSRWVAARDAAKAVIDLNIYSLFRPEPASAEEATENYHDLFISRQTEEDIFVRFYSTSADNGADCFVMYPNGWGGWGQNGITNDMVDSYEMVDGTTFSRSNPEQNLEPYKNRDPRFYATVIHEGLIVRPRPIGYQETDPEGKMQAGYWEVWDDETNSIKKVWGLDSPNSPIGAWNNFGANTGALKFIDTSVDINPTGYFYDFTWRHIRYSEIILNYVEACIELGEEEEARKYLNMIRRRGGMPDITDSGEELKKRYRNERRVELVLENHRYFDVRRWLIAPEAYGPSYGVSIVYELNDDHTTSDIPTITPIKLLDGNWEDKAYFSPISRDEINKNPELVNNPGYE